MLEDTVSELMWLIKFLMKMILEWILAEIYNQDKYAIEIERSRNFYAQLINVLSRHQKSTRLREHYVAVESK